MPGRRAGTIPAAAPGGARGMRSARHSPHPARPRTGAAKRPPLRVADLRGIHRLAIDATVGITDLVETVHDTILTPAPLLARRSAGRTRGITGFVYQSVRGMGGFVD